MLFREYMLNFIIEFSQAFEGIANRFGLTMIKLSEVEAGLCSSYYAILVYLDRDGVNVTYIQQNKSGEFLRYPLGYFLVTRRKWVASNKEEQISAELEAYSLTLENSAPDILRGESAWLAEYGQRPFPLDSVRLKALGLRGSVSLPQAQRG